MPPSSHSSGRSHFSSHSEREPRYYHSSERRRSSASGHRPVYVLEGSRRAPTYYYAEHKRSRRGSHSSHRFHEEHVSRSLS